MLGLFVFGCLGWAIACLAIAFAVPSAAVFLGTLGVALLYLTLIILAFFVWFKPLFWIFLVCHLGSVWFAVMGVSALANVKGNTRGTTKILVFFVALCVGTYVATLLSGTLPF